MSVSVRREVGERCGVWWCAGSCPLYLGDSDSDLAIFIGDHPRVKRDHDFPTIYIYIPFHHYGMYLRRIQSSRFTLVLLALTLPFPFHFSTKQNKTNKTKTKTSIHP